MRIMVVRPDHRQDECPARQEHHHALYRASQAAWKSI